MRRAAWWIIGAVAVIALLLLFRKHEPPQLAFARVTRQTVVSNLLTNGKVEPLQWESVRAEVPGLITSVPVQEGQNVSAGTVIARISQPGANQDLASAEARASQYQSELGTLQRGGKSENLAELDAEIQKTQYDREVAQRDFDSLSRLLAKQAATEMDVQLAKERVEAADIALKTLSERRKALVSPNDVAAGKARLAEAQADQSAAEAKLSVGIVRAPISGTIYGLPARPGAYVDAGTLIASVGLLDELRVKVFVDEPDLGRVRVGLPVHITWDGLPGRSWEGTVERLPTEIVPLNTREVGEVWVTISNTHHDLVPGTTVNVAIRTGAAQNAMVIPKTALRRDRGPVGVYVLRHNRLAWQPVKTGTSDVSDTSILSGLKDGELVLLPTDTPVAEGDRARPVVR